MTETLFELPPRYTDLQGEARALAESVRDIAARADEADHVDPEMRRRLRDSGLTGLVVTEEFGGRFAQVDSLAVTVVREALAAESAHLDSLFAMQGIGSYALSVGGSGPGPQTLAACGRVAGCDCRARADRAGCRL